MIYVISKTTFGEYEVRDIQCNANWCDCPYSDYALIPDNLVDGILATKGYCDITLNADGTEVASFTARTIPSVPHECCGDNTVLSINGVKANSNGELTLTPGDIGAQAQHQNATITLSASSWAGNSQTVTMDGLDKDDTVFSTPAANCYEQYIEYGVRLFAQNDGMLIYTCEDTPTVDLTVDVTRLPVGGSGVPGGGGGSGGSGGTGADGFSPIANVTQTSDGARITIIDKNGTTTATVTNGKDGSPGERGHSILKVTTAPTSYTTTTGGKAPIKRMALSTIKTQANVDEVLVGDQISYSYYLYNIYYLDATYAYMDVYTSIRGATGSKGDKGDTGETGPAGSDATVTADSIENALGYTPVKSSGWSANKNLGTDGNGNVIEKEDIFSKDTSTWSPVEYMNDVAWTEKGYYWTPSGTHTSTEYTQDYRSTTELIRIEPNCSYTFSKFSGVYFLYDSAGKNGVASTQHTNPNASLTFETNENQYYIGISPHEYLSTGNISLVRNTISEAEYNALPTKAATLQPLYGKQVVCFGDSLFGMYRGDDSAPAFVAAETGATVYNVGFGGCRMSVHPTSGYGAFSMWALAKAIAENDWTTQDAQASSGSAYFPEQLALLKSIDFSNVDIVVIHYGTNDFTAGYVLKIDNDADHDDYNTLCGALRYSIEKLLGAYPKLRIYVSLPCYRFWTDNGITYAETYTNREGKILPEFVEALRNTAAEYNLPVIDSYYGLGINKANADTFLGDGVHHNATGRERFGRYIGQNLIAQQTSGKSGMDTSAVNALISAAIGNAIGGSY